MIKSISYNQSEIIENIAKLYCDNCIEADVTYSKGVFYKSIPHLIPRLKFDLNPQDEETIKAKADQLPLNDESLSSLMFDPPFLAGYTKGKTSGIIGDRFTGFRYIADLWAWYDKCIDEFYRVLKPKGILIFKCQDTVSGGKQYFSHNHIMQQAQNKGFICKDLFVLLAKTRIKGHNHDKQIHARKFHSYFLVFTRRKNG